LRPRHLITSERDLALELEADDDAEQRGAFDEGGENERRRLDATGRFRLTRHAFHRRATDAADAQTGTDHGTTSSDTSTNRHQPFLAGGRGSLQQSEDFNHDKLSKKT